MPKLDWKIWAGLGAVVAFLIFISWRLKLPQKLIAKFEGFRGTAYPDGNGLSIGYGHQIQPHETALRTAKITQADASKLLADDIAKRYSPLVDSTIAGLGFNAAQRAALISFHYNTGAIGRIAPVLRSKDLAAIGAKLREYNKYQGLVNSGLVKRRAEESAVFA